MWPWVNPLGWINVKKGEKIMNKTVRLAILLMVLVLSPIFAQASFEKDVLPTAAGNVEVTFIGHGSLMLSYQGKIIHVDPSSMVTNYSEFPLADLVLLTHHHRDHLDKVVINNIRTERSKLILTEICAGEVDGGKVMKNGDKQIVMGIGIEAVPAYNLVHKRDNGQLLHPKGEGNGYILTIGDKRIYIAGDTENTPEMKGLKGIDYAFLPMNLPYTMTPEMVADAARAFRPKVLYPYHYGETDTGKVLALLRDEKDIEVRIRKMK